MKQVIRKGFQEIIVADLPDPTVGPHHVLIRTASSLISSGTESASIHRGGAMKAVAEDPSVLRKVWKTLSGQPPDRVFAEIKAKFSDYAVLGYSGAGTIVDRHPTVSDLEPGDRVAYGGEGTGHAETVRAGRNLVARVPDAVSFEHACFTTVGSIAMNAVRIAEIGLGQRVVVIGMGLVGQLVAQLARLQGAVVIALDLRPDRVELARKLGADQALAGDSSPRDAVLELTNGRGADCVMIAAAAKSAEPCRLAVQLCRDRGRIVEVGAVDLSFPWQEMYLKEIQLFMARAYGPGSYDADYEEHGLDYPFAYVRWTENRNMEEFLRLVALGRVEIEPLITHRFPIERAAEAYDTVMEPSSASLGVVLNYPAAAESDPVRSFRPQRRINLAPQSAVNGTIGVALAGAGNIARWVHLPNLKKISGIRVCAIHSTNGARARSYANRFGADSCYSSYEELLTDGAVQVVVIASRNQHHAAQALEALRAGKHVFVEKPMALTEEECAQLCLAVEETGRQLTVGFNRRFAPDYVGLKRHLAGRSGPAVLNCRVNSPGISGSYWMADPAVGGAILGEACHFADLMYWLLESEPISVSAYSLPTERREPVGQNNLVASFLFADGSVGNLTYCTVGSGSSGGERVEAFAQGIGVSSEDFKRLTVSKGVSRAHSRWFPAKGYADQMQAFIEGLRAGKPPSVSVFDGARATVVCLRILESARRLQPCQIDWKASLGLTSPP